MYHSATCGTSVHKHIECTKSNGSFNKQIASQVFKVVGYLVRAIFLIMFPMEYQHEILLLVYLIFYISIYTIFIVYLCVSLFHNDFFSSSTTQTIKCMVSSLRQLTAYVKQQPKCLVTTELWIDITVTFSIEWILWYLFFKVRMLNFL